MATAQTKFYTFAKDCVNGVHNFSSNSFKAMLTNSAPVAATNTVKGDITEIAAGNGYSTGGVACTPVTESAAGGVESIFFTNASVTASGGTVGPFRYAVFYNSTVVSPNGPLCSYVDYGSSVTLNSADVFNLTFDGTNGWLQAS